MRFVSHEIFTFMAKKKRIVEKTHETEQIKVDDLSSHKNYGGKIPSQYFVFGCMSC